MLSGTCRRKAAAVCAYRKAHLQPEAARRKAAANQMFEPRFARRYGEAREIDAAIGEQRKVLSGSENRRTIPG
jgi:hypothetical protein